MYVTMLGVGPTLIMIRRSRNANLRLAYKPSLHEINEVVRVLVDHPAAALRFAALGHRPT